MEHTVSPEHVGPVEWHIARMQDYAVSGRLSRVSECLAGSSEGCGRQKTPGVEGNLALEQGGSPSFVLQISADASVYVRSYQTPAAPIKDTSPCINVIDQWQNMAHGSETYSSKLYNCKE